MAYLDGDATAWFSRHLVILECVYKVRHRNKSVEEARAYYTGFLMYESDYLMWVTAGHCLDEIRDDLIGKPEYYDDIKFRLVDFIHNDPVSMLAVPFDFMSLKYVPSLFHTDPAGNELGWDFGCLILQPNYAENVLANKIVPVGGCNWKDIPSEFDMYYLLGIPGEKVERNEEGEWSVTPSMFSLTRVAERPEEYSHHTDEMFYATIDPGSDVGNVKGMSGGPIFGFKKMGDGKLRYWVIAIQSRWHPQKRLICATPLRPLRELVRDACEVANKNNERTTPGDQPG